MKKMNKKGFTLIELLAVIVILGLLMAIAIPSVTKYITQSRKKTLTNTISNYMSALTTEVNNMDYTFTGANTIYAVPIECIAVERGGTDPFGIWYPASTSQWAYVLVQYNDTSSSYTYGFTFKDTAGYGLLPTASTKLQEKGDQISTSIKTDFVKSLSELLPTKDEDNNTVYPKATEYVATTSKWSGFVVDDNTKLVVLKADTENDKVSKCITVQKAS